MGPLPELQGTWKLTRCLPLFRGKYKVILLFSISLLSTSLSTFLPLLSSLPKAKGGFTGTPNIHVALQDQEAAPFTNLLIKNPDVRVKIIDEPINFTDALINRECDLFLIVPGGFSRNLSLNRKTKLILLFDETNHLSSLGKRFVEEAAETYINRVFSEKLKMFNLTPDFLKKIEIKSVSVEAIDLTHKYLMLMLLTLTLLWMMVNTSTIAPLIEKRSYEKGGQIFKVLLSKTLRLASMSLIPSLLGVAGVLLSLKFLTLLFECFKESFPSLNNQLQISFQGGIQFFIALFSVNTIYFIIYQLSIDPFKGLKGNEKMGSIIYMLLLFSIPYETASNRSETIYFAPLVNLVTLLRKTLMVQIGFHEFISILLLSFTSSILSILLILETLNRIDIRVDEGIGNFVAGFLFALGGWGVDFALASDNEYVWIAWLPLKGSLVLQRSTWLMFNLALIIAGFFLAVPITKDFSITSLLSLFIGYTFTRAIQGQSPILWFIWFTLYMAIFLSLIKKWLKRVNLTFKGQRI